MTTFENLKIPPPDHGRRTVCNCRRIEGARLAPNLHLAHIRRRQPRTKRSKIERRSTIDVLLAACFWPARSRQKKTGPFAWLANEPVTAGGDEGSTPPPHRWKVETH